MLSTGGNFGIFISISRYHQCEKAKENRHLYWHLLENRQCKSIYTSSWFKKTAYGKRFTRAVDLSQPPV